MTQTLLFPEPADPIGLREVGECLRWTCPHCGGNCAGEKNETRESATADPACCFCRAEFAGMRFVEWRKQAQAAKEATRPPDGWRSSRTRSEIAS